jgi:hypothetical protein
VIILEFLDRKELPALYFARQVTVKNKDALPIAGHFFN